MRKEIPAGVLEMLAVPGLRPDKVLKLYKTLGITSLADLEQAAREDRIKGAMCSKALFPREDRGTDRIPTTMRRSAKRKRCLHVKALKSTAAFATPNTRPDNGTGSGADPRPATEKLSVRRTSGGGRHRSEPGHQKRIYLVASGLGETTSSVADVGGAAG
jgi:hypothetical protein